MHRNNRSLVNIIAEVVPFTSCSIRIREAYRAILQRRLKTLSERNCLLHTRQARRKPKGVCWSIRCGQAHDERQAAVYLHGGCIGTMFHSYCFDSSVGMYGELRMAQMVYPREVMKDFIAVMIARTRKGEHLNQNPTAFTTWRGGFKNPPRNEIDLR